MTLSQMNTILDNGANFGIDCTAYAEGKQEYSGRGMFGRTTYAVVCSRDSLSDLEEFIDEHMSFSPRIDNLGLDYIVY